MWYAINVSFAKTEWMLRYLQLPIGGICDIDKEGVRVGRV